MSGNFVGNRLTQSKLTHLMTSLVPGLRKRKLHFLPTFGGIEKFFLRARTELKFENYESVQHRLQFSGIKMGAKISFHDRHFKSSSSNETFIFLGIGHYVVQFSL